MHPPVHDRLKHGPCMSLSWCSMDRPGSSVLRISSESRPLDCARTSALAVGRHSVSLMSHESSVIGTRDLAPEKA